MASECNKAVICKVGAFRHITNVGMLYRQRQYVCGQMRKTQDRRHTGEMLLSSDPSNLSCWGRSRMADAKTGL